MGWGGGQFFHRPRPTSHNFGNTSTCDHGVSPNHLPKTLPTGQNPWKDFQPGLQPYLTDPGYPHRGGGGQGSWGQQHRVGAAAQTQTTTLSNIHQGLGLDPGCMNSTVRSPTSGRGGSPTPTTPRAGADTCPNNPAYSSVLNHSRRSSICCFSGAALSASSWAVPRRRPAFYFRCGVPNSVGTPKLTTKWWVTQTPLPRMPPKIL